MKRRRALLGILPFICGTKCDTLPYNPTRIFARSNSSLAYIFAPSSSSSNEARLTALDVGSAFSAANYDLQVISNTLPFLDSGSSTPYTPTIDADGNITVVTGTCSEIASKSEIWRFQPGTDDSSASGTWKQYSTSYKQGANNVDYTTPGYLANGIAFGGSTASSAQDPTIYMFGGMCPYNNSTENTWQARADYSNNLLTISPDATQYQISLEESRGPPVPQAGTSITGLTPTYGTSASGETTTQQEDFVLLGGNTPDAFINMSQIALFSLPQQSWSFVEVAQPAGGKADLAIRSTDDTITPRSGHTAVLSENGDSIIMYGGWVGDIDTPAQPQLAILELGSGYGGSGDWRWVVPEQSGENTELGTGLYGHGAVMLPGGVMMVLGGYEITGSPLSKRSAQTANNRLSLYNTTSRTWLDSYTPPASTKEKPSNGPLSNTSAKAGLGAGLGIGAALLVTMVGFYAWYSKRLRSEQEDRERALLSASPEGPPMTQSGQPLFARRPDGVADVRLDYDLPPPPPPPPPPRDDFHFQRKPIPHATGAFIDVPSPTRGLRKSSGGRAQFQAALRQQDQLPAPGIGVITPITEASENGDEIESTNGGYRRHRAYGANTVDPFLDPEPAADRLRVHRIDLASDGTVRRVPTSARARLSTIGSQGAVEQQIANWAGDGSSTGPFEDREDGFTSVRGDDRTLSTLTDQSHRSTISMSSITRTMSTRTGASMMAALAAGTAQRSPRRSSFHERSNTLESDLSFYSQPSDRAQTLASNCRPQAGGAGNRQSIISAQTNAPQSQPESDVLLSATRSMDPDDPYQRAAQSLTRPKAQQPAYRPTHPPPMPTRRRPGLLGSLRRALNAVSMSDRSVSLGNNPSDPNEQTPRIASSSPTKLTASGNRHNPRRTVSEASALLRQKRGQKDWLQHEGWEPYKDDPAGVDWGEPRSSTEVRQAEGDWDVEGAAGQRDFQVMFSIPKSKLRVVNDDMDRASLRSASDGALSRSASVRREGSVKGPARMFGEGSVPPLPSTREEGGDVGRIKGS